jgi:hypothetical protein
MSGNSPLRRREERNVTLRLRRHQLVRRWVVERTLSRPNLFSKLLVRLEIPAATCSPPLGPGCGMIVYQQMIVITCLCRPLLPLLVRDSNT